MAFQYIFGLLPSEVDPNGECEFDNQAVVVYDLVTGKYLGCMHTVMGMSVSIRAFTKAGAADHFSTAREAVAWIRSSSNFLDFSL